MLGLTMKLCVQLEATKGYPVDIHGVKISTGKVQLVIKVK